MLEHIARAAENFFAPLGKDFIHHSDELCYRAEKMIDIVTHNRLNSMEWDGLTPYQQRTLKECFCEIVQFLYENKDLLETPLASYSINGVSMQLRFNQDIYCQSGVIMRQSTYSRIVSTGLCYAGGL